MKFPRLLYAISIFVFPLIALPIFTSPLSSSFFGQLATSEGQLEKWLKQYLAADANGDGKLTSDEANVFRKQLTAKENGQPGNAKRWKKSPNGKWKRGVERGVKRNFKVNPGWELEQFPTHAVSLKSPGEIKAIFEKAIAARSKLENGKAANRKPRNGKPTAKQPVVVSYSKPTDGAIRVVGIGHSFMMPGYQTMPLISQAAGMKQPLYTHVGGGMTGSARYKWEQENGIFQFDGKPFPKLLASIANAEWDAMMFGPYFNDRPIYFSCWIDFCLKHNPDMKFYFADAWPQLGQLDKIPTSEAFFTVEKLDQMGKKKRVDSCKIFDPLRAAYPGKVFVLPTSDAMVLAAKQFVRGELPGIEGLHRVIGKKERSLWKDQLGHLGPGLERLEGYVFYATLYGRSPELIGNKIAFGGDARFPSPELDQMFRKIAWQAVKEHPYSGASENEDTRNGGELNEDSKEFKSRN